jgi:CheY-like chemotaxis protein
VADLRPCVLLVDDEKAVLYTTQLILEANGYIVVTAGNADEAMSRFKTIDVDIAVIDFGVAYNGGAFLPTAIKALRPKVKTIIFSGSSDAENHRDGVDLYLLKPNAPVELLKAIEDMLAA